MAADEPSAWGTALDWQLPTLSTVLSGYSFGGMASLRMEAELYPRQLCGLSSNLTFLSLHCPVTQIAIMLQTQKQITCHSLLTISVLWILPKTHIPLPHKLSCIFHIKEKSYFIMVAENWQVVKMISKITFEIKIAGF